MSHIYLKLFGRIELRSPAGEALALSSRKAIGLLAYLARARGNSARRDHLATALWPDSGEAHARQSLRQALSNLRRALPEQARELVTASGDNVVLNRDLYRDDVTEFILLTETDTTDDLRRAVDLWDGELMDGFNARSSTFDDWLMQERMTLRERMLGAMTQLLERYEGDSNDEAAIRTGVKLVSIDPLREDAHRALMRLYARRGQIGSALRQYRICRENLRRELDVEPEASTDAAYRELARRRREPAADKHTDPPSPTAAATGDDSQSIGSQPGREPSTDLRQCTVLSLSAAPNRNLDDPERSSELARRFAEFVESQLRRRGAPSVQRVGRAVVATFGIPRASSSDAGAAFAAAVALRDELAAEAQLADVQTRISMVSGQAIVSANSNGTDSNAKPALDETSALMALSLEVNAATPPDTIVATEGIRHALADTVTAQALADAPPGYPYRVWRIEPNTAPQRTQAPARMIGRQTELLVFEAAVEACLGADRGQVFALRGEAGIGKTRLLDAFLTVAGGKGVVCHYERLLDFGDVRGRDPLRSLACTLLDLSSVSTAAQRLDAAHRVLQEHGETADASLHLFDLLDVRPEDEQATLLDAMDGETRRLGRTQALATLIKRAAAREPLLIAVEDLHWADADLLRMLASIARLCDTHRVFVVLTTRPGAGAVDTLQRSGLGGMALTTLDLAPLRTDECTALAEIFAEQAHHHDHDPAFVAKCVERSGGNPFFLDQLLRAGEARVSAVPDSVHSIVWARLDTLADEDKRALQAASVLGQRFRLADLRDLLGNPGYDSAELVDQRLLREEVDRYAFTHALIAEGIYESMTRAQRRPLHAKAAQRYADRDPVVYAEHLERAGDPAAAKAYLAAATALTRTYRYEQVLRLIERFLGPVQSDTGSSTDTGLDLDDEALSELERVRGDVLRETGEVQTSLHVFARAAERVSEPTPRCRALIGQAAALRILDRQTDALEVLDSAEGIALELGASFELAQVFYHRGAALFPIGRVAECLEANERSLEYAREVGSARYEARALGGLGDAHYQRGELVKAAHYFASSVEVARKHGHLRLVAANLSMLALTRFYHGEPDVSLQLLDEAERLATSLGDVRGMLLAISVRVLPLLYADRSREAIDIGEHTLALSRKLGSRRFEVEALINCARIHFALGDADSARRLAHEAEKVHEPLDPAYVGSWMLATRALVADRPEARLNYLDKGEALLTEGSVSHNHFHYYELAIRVSLDERDWTRATRYADALANYTRGESVPFVEFVVERCRLLTALGSGEPAGERREALEALLSRGRSMKLGLLNADIEQALAQH